MLNQRRVNKARYLFAGLLTALIFVSGLLLGLVIEGERIGYIQQQNVNQKLDFSSLQTQYAYLDQIGAERDCSKLSKTFDQSVTNLEQARIKLVSYSQNTQTNEEEFGSLKREYMLNQIQYWLFSKKLKQLCGQEFSTILYFYSTNEKCPSCADQEFVLTYLKKKFNDKLLNFALDSDYESEAMIQLLKVNYDITTYPTIIINEQKFEGFLETEKVLAEICKNLENEEECLT